MRIKENPKDFHPGDLIKVFYKDSIDYFFIGKVKRDHVLARFVLITDKNGIFLGLNSTVNQFYETNFPNNTEIIRAG